MLFCCRPFEWVWTSFPRLCNSDPCFPSGRRVQPTPVCHVHAIFALSEFYLSFSSPSGRVCESRQAVFAERFVIIRRASLGQRSRAPLPWYANNPPPVPLHSVQLNGVSAEAWRRRAWSWRKSSERKVKEADWGVLAGQINLPVCSADMYPSPPAVMNPLLRKTSPFLTQ